MTNKMTNPPANPLAAIISRAASSLPKDTGATAGAAARRSAPQTRVVLADVSRSMGERAAGRRKIDALRESLSGVDATVIAFSDRLTELPPGAAAPEPDGGTALHLALDHAACLGATHVLVISDGHPDDPGAALRAADRLRARIDVIYCGPDRDVEGIEFMRRLARGGGGARHEPLPTRSAIQALLPGRP